MQIDINKCDFKVQNTKYLGFIIKANKGIHIDPKKVKAILDWEQLLSVKGVHSFLGFANFYYYFIRDFSNIIIPLTSLTKKGVEFQWTNKANNTFNKLKHMFTTIPVLI